MGTETDLENMILFNQMTYKDFFVGKHITVVGLGPHCEMYSEIKFLLTLGAKISVVDPRNPDKLGPVVEDLKTLGLQNLITGRFTKNDIHQGDIILLAPDVNPHDQYISEARALGVRIETPQTLLLSLAPSVTVIGIMGTCGKTTVSYLVYEILKKAFMETAEQNIFTINPEVAGSLPYLKKIKKGDIVVARIPSEYIPLYRDARIVPHVVVYTAISNELIPLAKKSQSAVVIPVPKTAQNEGDSVDKRSDLGTVPEIFSILPLQTYNNFIVASDYVIDSIRDCGVHVSSKMLRTGVSIVPDSWILHIKNSHEKEDVSLALRVAELFKIPLDTSKEIIESFVGLKGRLELVKKNGGVDFYNDTASVTPLSTLAALKSVSNNRNVVLILGGAYRSDDANKGDDVKILVENIPQYAHTVILLPGSGTLRMHRELLGMHDVTLIHAQSVGQAVDMAKEHARKGDGVVFSPGFAAGGFERSVAERGATFMRAVRSVGPQNTPTHISSTGVESMIVKDHIPTNTA